MTAANAAERTATVWHSFAAAEVAGVVDVPVEVETMLEGTTGEVDVAVEVETVLEGTTLLVLSFACRASSLEHAETASAVSTATAAKRRRTPRARIFGE